MHTIDLTTLLKDHQGQWVALSEDNNAVYGAGTTAPAAVADARSKGYEDFTLLYVRPFDVLYCGGHLGA